MSMSSNCEILSGLYPGSTTTTVGGGYRGGQGDRSATSSSNIEGISLTTMQHITGLVGIELGGSSKAAALATLQEYVSSLLDLVI